MEIGAVWFKFLTQVRRSRLDSIPIGMNQRRVEKEFISRSLFMIQQSLRDESMDLTGCFSMSKMYFLRISKAAVPTIGMTNLTKLALPAQFQVLCEKRNLLHLELKRLSKRFAPEQNVITGFVLNGSPSKNST